ncbi:YqiA/YcfP family alpha/beta fold hydrolase [Orrella sp. 11846]|uniref:YqiA/YcfP family alpha/beta fold hydrolase n=1 Tax=Orrella sp. 11846 TaxID=3409913 RepID=UPI003B59B874
MILYLHGFRSSPQSFKSQRLRKHLASLGRLSQWACPALPVQPDQAIQIASDEAQRLLREHPDATPDQLTIIGSSLGGFYAIYLAEKLGCRAVLLNPAVHADRDLEKYLGELTNFHTGEAALFTREDLDNLRALVVPNITRPERYFLIAATGDEVLNWREMQAMFAQSPQKIIAGSDHGLSDFEQHLTDVMAFVDANTQK